LPDGTGLDVLRTLRSGGADTPCVILTAFGDVSSAVEAMKLGASDFLEKPVEIDDLCLLARRLTERASASGLQTARFEVPGAPVMIGAHPSFQAALKLLRKVAPTEGTVLLLGESGTGKELFARALHALSSRRDGVFVALNCAAVPEALLESELFGHEKGAFTGAAARRIGRFERAEGGTLFLDEIGELESGVQAKLLRVLEERTFERVGGQKTLQAQVRVVTATNVDLHRRVEQGRFRADLFYRLDVFPIRLPALRERGSDVPLLATYLLEGVCQRNGLEPRRLSPSASEMLSRQPWPGNVRQLANVVERAAVMSEQEELGLEELEAALHASVAPQQDSESASLEAAGRSPGVGPEHRSAESAELEDIEQALLATQGDKHAAALRLGISYRTLQRRIVRYDLEGFPKYRGSADG
jgi:DNA-binding NtrC family response regulator